MLTPVKVKKNRLIRATLNERNSRIAAISQRVATSCDIGNPEEQNEFVVTGRGGVPAGLNDLVNADKVSVPWVVTSDEDPAPLVGQSSPPESMVIVEAQGVAIDALGNMHLVPHSDVFTSPNLQAATSEFCQTVASQT